MKLDCASEDKSLIIGDLSEKKFGIIANDKMFSILSSKIYTDKIKAPIRELSTNAYDAHVSVNKKDVPFDIHLPFAEEPYFYIRDYGNGMSSKMIEELYTTYGWSDKKDSNAYVGCLGLGSKSPFAYTDSFDVISIHEGMKYIYKCYMEQGIPCIMKFDEFKTEEQSGVMVKFDVIPIDFSDFLYKSSRFFQWFDVKPNCIGKISMNYCTWDKIDGIYYTNGSSSGVLMGNILYGFDFVFDYIKKNNLQKSNYSSILDYLTRIVIKCKIGDYDIAASRENLEKTDKNAEKLCNYLSDFYGKQEKKFENVLQKNSNKSIIEKNKILNKQFGNIPWLYDKIRKYLKDNLTIDFEENKCLFIKREKTKKGYSSTKIKGSEYIYHVLHSSNNCFAYTKELICKKSFYGYCVDNDMNIYLINDKDLYEKFKIIGIKEVKIDNYIPKTDFSREKYKGYLYTFDYNDYKNKYKINKYNTIDKILDKEKSVLYIPIHKNEICGLELKGLNYNWLDKLLRFFKKRVYAAHVNDVKILESKKNCINLIQYLNKNFSDLSKFENVENRCTDFTNNESFYFKNLDFDESLMNKEELKNYHYVTDFFKKENGILSNVNKVTNKEKLFLNLFGRKMYQNKKNDFMDFLSKKFPLVKLVIDGYYTNYTILESLKEYIQLKEEKIRKEKTNE